MNPSHWTERLSEYLDGDLAAPEREACEAHLAACTECARLLEELKSVALHARALPPAPPPADVWGAIESRLETPVLHLRPRAELRERLARQFSLSGLQLASAAAALVAVTAGAMWLATRGPAPANVPATGGAVALAPRDTTPLRGESREEPAVAALEPLREDESGERDETSGAPARRAPAGRESREAPAGEQLAAFEERSAPAVAADFGLGRYDAAIAELETSLAASRSTLDSSTVRVVEQNLAIIDRAIADARTALAADPSSRYLNAHLASTMRRKVDMLRRVNSLARI